MKFTRLPLPNATDHQEVERVMRHRPFWMACGAAFTLFQTAACVTLATFRFDLVWCASMLAGLFQFTAWSTSRFRPRMRSLLEDEANTAIRDGALRAGFWSALVAAGAIVLVSRAFILSAAQGAEIIGGVALTTACATHAFLDRRTLTGPS